MGQGWGFLGHQVKAASLVNPPLWVWAMVGRGWRRVGLLLRPLEDLNSGSQGHGQQQVLWGQASSLRHGHVCSSRGSGGSLSNSHSPRGWRSAPLAPGLALHPPPAAQGYQGQLWEDAIG